jgi:hypothetical protein
MGAVRAELQRVEGEWQRILHYLEEFGAPVPSLEKFERTPEVKNVRQILAALDEDSLMTKKDFVHIRDSDAVASLSLLGPHRQNLGVMETPSQFCESSNSTGGSCIRKSAVPVEEFKVPKRTPRPPSREPTLVTYQN